jgi:hypothetical protein
MVLHREHSKDLLRIWRAQLDKEVDDGDNDAYLTAYHMVEKEIAEMQQGGRDSKKIINDNNDAITTTNRITEKDYNTSRNNTSRGGSSSNSGGSSKQSRASNLAIKTDVDRKFNQFNHSFNHNRSRRFASNFSSEYSNIRSKDYRHPNSTTIVTTTSPLSFSKGRSLIGDPDTSYPNEATDKGIYSSNHSV